MKGKISSIPDNYDGYVLNLLYDHDRAMRTIDTDGKKLLQLLEKDRLETVRSIEQQLREKNEVLQSLARSRDERIAYVSRRLNEESAEYITGLSGCATNARYNGTGTIEGTEKKIGEIISVWRQGISSKTDTHVQALKLKYESYIMDLREYAMSQRCRLESEAQDLDRSILRSKTDIAEACAIMQRLRAESVSEHRLHELELEYDNVKQELLEADRESVTFRNFEKACQEMDSELDSLTKSIQKIKTSLGAGSGNLLN